MFDFLKTFGLGLLYIILLPFIIILVAVYTTYCLFLFIYYFIKRITMFFLGYNMKEEMKIDKIAKLHLENQIKETEDKPAVVPNTTTTNNNSNTYVQQIFLVPDQNGQYPNLNQINSLGYNPIENPIIHSIETENKEKEIEEDDKNED